VPQGPGGFSPRGVGVGLRVDVWFAHQLAAAHQQLGRASQRENSVLLRSLGLGRAAGEG